MSATGRLVSLQGESFECDGMTSAIGDLVHIKTRDRLVKGVVTGFRDGHIIGELLESAVGISIDSVVTTTGKPPSIPAGECSLGRVFDPTGKPVDGKEQLESGELSALFGKPGGTIRKPEQQLQTGLRTLDGLVPIFKGQQVLLYGDSGLGACTTLQILGRNCEANVVVYALLGADSKNCQDYLEEVCKLGQKATTFTAPKHATAVARRLCLESAVTAAISFSNQDKDVILIVDSLTAWEDAGQFFVKGIAETLARLRSCSKGSITSFFRVQDTFKETRGSVFDDGFDGRVVLSKKMAEACIYPAIDPVTSFARKPAEQQFDGERYDALSILEEYQGNEKFQKKAPFSIRPPTDSIEQKTEQLISFLRQGVLEEAPLDKTKQRLKAILAM